MAFLNEHLSQEYDEQYFKKFQNLRAHFHYIFQKKLSYFELTYKFLPNSLTCDEMKRL